ncbi:hypothetical protein E3P99_00691 [Wallemia hederae]|uniref:Protein N-terminal glutamine amidohydrolase n=1 Tax=Wallemia hederae TaxID=1540922 RepID=A0A4T0FX71_9BASI|nr:hypothetical protein E3P99_00691 [Wallemia hederae]
MHNTPPATAKRMCTSWRKHYLARRRYESVLLFEQEASQYDAPHPVLWDYHVILLLSLAGREYVVDLDTRLDKVIEKNAYLEHTFSSKTPPAYRASISVTPAHIFLNTFASDRRHMKSASGVFSSPPPPWSCIKGTDASSPHNLDDWIDGAIDGSEVIQPVYV